MKSNNKKYLIVYNTCGISGKDNSSYYVNAINTIIQQDYDDYVLAISCCKNDELKVFLKDNLFLKKEHFDYNKINRKILKGEALC